MQIICKSCANYLFGCMKNLNCIKSLKSSKCASYVQFMNVQIICKFFIFISKIFAVYKVSYKQVQSACILHGIFLKCNICREKKCQYRYMTRPRGFPSIHIVGYMESATIIELLVITGHKFWTIVS